MINKNFYNAPTRGHNAECRDPTQTTGNSLSVPTFSATNLLLPSFLTPCGAIRRFPGEPRACQMARGEERG